MNKSSLYGEAKKYQDKGLLDKAYKYYLEAALTEDDGDAMCELGYMYYEGEYVNQDYDKAGYYFGLAYDRGAEVLEFTLIIAGSYWENMAKEEGRIPEDAIRYYEAAIEAGVDYGYECLGKVYLEQGQYDKALENLKHMDGKSPCGFYCLGKMYDEGLGVEPDLVMAVENYKKAIEVGSGYEEEVGEDDDVIKAKRRMKELKMKYPGV